MLAGREQALALIMRLARSHIECWGEPMTTFAAEGFFSAEIEGVEKTIASRYPKKFQLAAETNRMVHRVLYSIRPHDENVAELMLAALLTRQAASFQGF